MMKGMLVGVVALTVMMAAGAHAVTFTGTASGDWTNVVSSEVSDVWSITNNDLGGVAGFSWGADAPSFFTFDGVGSDGDPVWSVDSEVAFSIGAFEYFNATSTSGWQGIDGVSLDVTLNILSPLADVESYEFDFTIINTPNDTGDPVLDGDIVNTINAFSPTVFMYDGVQYTLQLLGFSSDGGTSIRTDFSSPENARAGADVYAKITSEIPPIPEPATMILFGLGVCSMAVRRLRKV